MHPSIGYTNVDDYNKANCKSSENSYTPWSQKDSTPYLAAV
jgi:hypothetical protein